MPVSMDRFQPPGWNDEMHYCLGCHDRYHYGDLTDEGYCPDCAKDAYSYCGACGGACHSCDLDLQGICDDCGPVVYGKFVINPQLPLIECSVQL